MYFSKENKKLQLVQHGGLYYNQSNKAPLLYIHIYIKIFIYLYIDFIYTFRQWLEDSLQNQVSCGSLNLQVNLVSGYLNHRRNQGNFLLPCSISTKLAPRTTIFIHSKNAIKLNYIQRRPKFCKPFPVTANLKQIKTNSNQYKTHK